MNSRSNTALPKGWIEATLGEIAHVSMGQAPPGDSYTPDPDIGMPFLQGNAEFGELFPTPVKGTTEPKKVTDGRSVLVSVRAPVGAVNFSPGEIAIGRGLAAVTPYDGIDRKLVFWLLLNSRAHLESQGTGTTFKAISGAVLKALPVPLPPRAEQERIVAAVDAAMAAIDSGDAAVDQAEQRLVAFRAAVLWAGIRGALATQDSEDEPADIALGQQGIEYSHDPELPRGWASVRLDQLVGASGLFTDGDWVLKEHLERPGSDVRLLQLGNLGIGKLKLKSERWISSEVAEELDCTILVPGDVLISRMADPLIRAAVLPDLGYSSITAVDVAIVRLPGGAVKPEFLAHAMNSPQMRAQAEAVASGTTRKRISRSKLGALRVPVPPRAEQERIVSAIDNKLAMADPSMATSHRELSTALRQSILHHAFTGRLVAQQRGDDPADQILGSIRARATA